MAGPVSDSDAASSTHLGSHRAERRRLTHVDRTGRPRMVDVSDKPVTARRAVAEAVVAMSAETLSLVIDGRASKGDVLSVAEIAGVMGGKRTSELIPLCHPLPLTDLVVAVTPDRGNEHAPRPRRSRHAVADRRRDGGADRGVGGRAHDLRHGQGRRARRRDPVDPPRLEVGRRERRVEPRGRRAGRWAADPALRRLAQARWSRRGRIVSKRPGRP